ncbi:MAG: hypothetical protein JRC86_12220, partial [Deltaproteobacteria bacterium]|nr:hypothetical protein [Deltaproteobacteria bacterium]
LNIIRTSTSEEILRVNTNVGGTLCEIETELADGFKFNKAVEIELGDLTVTNGDLIVESGNLRVDGTIECDTSLTVAGSSSLVISFNTFPTEDCVFTTTAATQYVFNKHVTTAEGLTALGGAILALGDIRSTTGDIETTAGDINANGDMMCSTLRPNLIQGAADNPGLSITQTSPLGSVSTIQLNRDIDVTSDGYCDISVDGNLTLHSEGAVSLGGPNASSVRIDGDLAFFGFTPTGQKTVSGDTEGNAALQSLLSALEQYNLINDTTT